MHKSQRPRSAREEAMRQRAHGHACPNRKGVTLRVRGAAYCSSARAPPKMRASGVQCAQRGAYKGAGWGGGVGCG